MTTDWPGIITAFGVLVVACANAYIIIQGARRDKKLTEVHDLVNGMTKGRDKLIEDKARREGGDAERKKPTRKR